MAISSMPIQERIARVLAGVDLSANGEGTAEHAASSVDMEWEDHLDTAEAVLRAIRHPDRTMAQAGDHERWPEIWEAMVLAALNDR